jgi:hypothetical protein
MSAISNYLENALLNATLTNTTYTSPASVYLGLFTSNPTDSNAGTELSAPSYTRQVVSFGAASSGSSSNVSAISYDQATTDWGTIGWVGLYDAATSGNLLYYGALDTATTIDINEIFVIPIGNLTVTLS